MLASGAAELVSLGTVLPFMAVLSDPSLLWKYRLIKEVAIRFGLTEATQLLIPATLAFSCAALVAAVIRLTNLWLNGRIAAAVGSDLSCEAYRKTLYQPYGVHVERSTVGIITNTTTQITQTIVAFNALLQLITSSVVAAGLLFGLLWVDSTVALSAAILFGSAYFLLAVLSRRELRINGLKIAESSENQLKALQEGLGAIRDVLLDGTQSVYLEIYRNADRPQRTFQAKNAYLASFPRYALEALGMISIALFGGILVWQRGSGEGKLGRLGQLEIRQRTGCRTASRKRAERRSAPRWRWRRGALGG